MTLEDCGAGTSEDIVNSRHAIRTSCREFIARLVETGIEHFVVVAAELFNALPSSDIPQTRRPVDAASQAVVAREVELAA